MTESELRAELKSKKLRPAYVFYGEESYTARAALNLVFGAAGVTDDPFNLNKFDGEQAVSEVVSSALSVPFMAEKRVVVWRDCPVSSMSESDFKALLGLISDLPEGNLLVFMFETVEIDLKRPPERFRKLVKAVQSAGGESVSFLRRRGAELGKMLSEGASRRGCMLMPPVAAYMVEICGDDLSTLLNELQKLCSYAYGQNITRETIDKICTRNIEVSIYDLSRKLIMLDMNGVYTLLGELLYKKTPAVFILSVLSSSFIDMYRAKILRAAGEIPENHCADFGYGENLKFRLRNAARDSSRLSAAALCDCLEALGVCDRNLKQTGCDEKIELEMLVTTLAFIIEGAR